MYWGKPVIVNLTPKKDNVQFEQVTHGKTGYFANTPKDYSNRVNYLLENKEVASKISKNVSTKAKEIYPEQLWIKLNACYRFCVFGDNQSKLVEMYKSIITYKKNYLSDIKNFNTRVYFPSLIFNQVYWKIADYIECKYEV